jgi:hypothetical protein
MQCALNFKVIRLACVLFEFNVPDIDHFFVLLCNDLGFDTRIWNIRNKELLYWPLHRYGLILVKQ